MNLSDQDHAELLTYLEAQYRGIFPKGQLARHEADYIGLEIARQEVELVAAVLAPGARVLDVGCGFGSFVLAARQQGYEAFGVDVAEFEVAFARKRQAQAGRDEDSIYRVGDGQALPYASESFNAVTLWNVIEHVPDDEALVAECVRLLEPGGYLFIICPNYAAFREEAHYHVPWLPLLPRKLARRYLMFLGRDPSFFEADIHYRTNRGVLATLKKHGLTVHDPLYEKMSDPAKIKSRKIRAVVSWLTRTRLLGLAKPLFALRFYNPLKQSVLLYAQKRSLSGNAIGYPVGEHLRDPR
jgi:MPBQ/MSBQ methyltransferase